MTRTIISDFEIILLLLIIVKLSANVLNDFHSGLAWALASALLIALVPAALAQIGQFLLKAKRYRVAEEILRLVIPCRRVECILPLNYFGQLVLASLDQLGTCLREQQRYTEALKISDQAVHFAEKRFGPQSMALTESLINRSGLLSLMGDLPEAEQIAQRALNILDQQSSPMDKRRAENLSLLLNNVGLVFANSGKPQKADEMLKRALDLKEATFGKDSPQIQVAYANQGYAYLKAQNYRAAEEYLKRAIKLGENKSENTLLTGNMWNNLGDALRGQGQLDQAELALNEALRIRQLTLPKNHPYMGYSYNNFGKLYCDQGKYDQAKQYFEKALNLRQSISAAHPDTAVTLADYAALLRKMGQIPEAEKLEARANSRTTKNVAPQPATAQKETRDSATTILVRTFVLISLVILLPLGSLMFVDVRAPKKVPEGLGASQYYTLGIIYKGAGWIELSRDALNRAIKLDPKGSIGTKAGVFLKTSVPRYPVSQEATDLNIEGFNQHASGDDTKAIATYEECIKTYPTFEWPYSNLGSLYVDKGDTAKAKELFNKALAINPSYVNAWVGMAKAKRKENDAAGAQQCIDNALACAQGDTMIIELVKRGEGK